MPGGREGSGNGYARLVEFEQQALMLGLFGALLAEPFSLVLERAGPGRCGEPGDRLRVVLNYLDRSGFARAGLPRPQLPRSARSA